ncbi:MAG: sugar ABC transporter ATP-binding protein [Acidobacteriota bacterium]
MHEETHQIPVLQMRGISKRFPGVIALADVAFEIYAGEVVALIGENGAGKSTLMKILGGVESSDAGEIRLDGEVVNIRSPRQASMLGIEFIHQELRVLDNLDVAANIFLRREPTTGGWLKLIDRKRIYGAADQQLKKVGLDISSRAMLATLSIAQKQLVEIARALSAGARILIMDEPTSSLTLSETNRLLDIIRELKKQGVSIIYITHRLEEAQLIADRVVALRDGHNVGVLKRAEISREVMVRMMVGRDLRDMFTHSTNADAAQSNSFAVSELRTLKYPHTAVSFTVRRGELIGLAGLVGAGRSEIARAIFGVDEKLGGEISLGGKKLAIHTPQDAIREGVLLAPEDRRQSGVIVEFNIRENISLPALKKYSRSGWIDSAKETRVAQEMTQAMNIKAPTSEVQVATLSGGNQQKVVLAKWLSLEPKVLIFDEPTRGIDVGAKAEIYALIRNLAAKGVAIIVISSEMEEVLGISDRIAVMHEGSVAGILERHEFSEEAVMHLATGGER